VSVFVSLLWTSGIVIILGGRPKGTKAICCKRKRIKKDKREEFLRDWLKDVELRAKRNRRVRKMKRRWKLIYRGSCPRTGQEIALVTSAQWELSDSFGRQ
jgi:hypothetical protein